jgi:hypothetical protein
MLGILGEVQQILQQQVQHAGTWLACTLAPLGTPDHYNIEPMYHFTALDGVCLLPQPQSAKPL